MARARQEKTIAFYDIVESVDGGQQEFAAPLRWDAALNHAATWNFNERRITSESGRDVIGSPTPGKEAVHLLLHKARLDGDWMSRADLSTGSVEELITAQDERFLDTAVVCFVPDRNRIGVLRGGSAAPTHNDLMQWLNRMNLFNDTTFVVTPVVRKAEVARFQAADAVQRINLRFGPEANLDDGDGTIADNLRILLDRYPGASVTLTVAMGRSRPSPAEADGRALLKEDMVNLLPALDSSARAEVGLLFQEGANYAKQQLVDLIEHDLTLKTNLVEEAGTDRALRLLEAVEYVESLIVSRSELHN